MSDEHQEAQEAWNAITAEIPSHIQEDGLFIHIGTLTGFVTEMMQGYQYFASRGMLDLDDRAVVAQLALLDSLTMAVLGFQSKHSEEIAAWEVEHTDFDNAVKRLQAEDFLNRLFNMNEDEGE